ncbi:MAG: GTP-binding protein, partial [Pseudomonadota bacterium]
MSADIERLTRARDALLLTLGGPSLDDSIDASNQTKQVPVTILSGFLGAGKTTLLCQLLENASIEIVAIVNDIAALNIDAALIRSKNAETIALENGCACCVLGTDLHESLHEIGKRDQPPDAIVIEASGLADPIGLAQTVANENTTVLDG